MLIEILSKD